MSRATDVTTLGIQTTAEGLVMYKFEERYCTTRYLQYCVMLPLGLCRQSRQTLPGSGLNLQRSKILAQVSGSSDVAIPVDFA